MANTIDLNAPNTIVPATLTGPTDVAQASQSRRVETTRDTSAQATNDPSASDGTQLSALGNVLANATSQASAQSSFRAERVANLKAQIASGNYQVDMQGLARTIAGVLGGTTT